MARTPTGYGILPVAVDCKRTSCRAGRYESVPPVQESSAHVGQAPPSPHEGSCELPVSTRARASPPPATPGIRTDRNRKFASVLGARVRVEDEGAAQAGQAACQWSRDASVISPADRSTAPPQSPSPVQVPHRLLLADSPGHETAWLRIEGGRFAGAEIHLALSGARVEVCVLTPHEASRQTLAIAMEAARNRLRARGLTMVDAGPPPRQARSQLGDAVAHSTVSWGGGPGERADL